MTDYAKSTNFTAKDSLPPGDSGKIIRGSEFDTEFSAVQTAVNSKADKSSPTFTGTLTTEGLTASGTFTLGGTAITATAAELNILDGVTATTAELNILDGVTATASELNILDGVTATTAELNYVDGVTSNIQTQLDGKTATAHTHAAADVTSGTFANARISQASVTQHEAAIDAGSVDGYDIRVDSGSPSGTDANTIYFVT